jgi:hypothetical protein
MERKPTRTPDVALSFSRALAQFVGIVTPLSEVARRQHQLLDPAAVPLWIDDMLLGGFLLYGAWRVASDQRTGRPILAAAWGFMCGLAYYSFFGQLQRLAEPDPSGLAPVWVIAVKGVGLVLGVVGMVAALQSPEPMPNATAVGDRGRH